MPAAKTKTLPDGWVLEHSQEPETVTPEWTGKTSSNRVFVKPGRYIAYRQLPTEDAMIRQHGETMEQLVAAIDAWENHEVPRG